MAKRQTDRHLSAEGIRALASGRGGAPGVLRLALDHLGRRCPACEAVLEAYSRERIVARAAGEQVVRRRGGRGLDLARETQGAPALAAELLEAEITADTLARAWDSPRFHTWGLASTLIDRSEAALEECPAEARIWALLAVMVAAKLDPAVYGERVVAEARALAGVRLGLALLEEQGDLAAAEAELARAEALGAGAVEPAAVEAEVELARARLDLAAGRFDAARARSERVEELACGPRLVELRLEAFLLQGRALRAGGAHSAALAVFLVLRAVLREHGELPELERRAALEIAETRCRLGEPSAALRALAALDDADGGEELGRTGPRRAYWAGVGLRGLGRIEEAAESLEAAWRGLAAQGAGLEAVRAFLDLAALLLDAQRPGALAQLLEEAAELYRIERLPRGAALALLRIEGLAARGGLDAGSLAAEQAGLEAVPGEPEVPPAVH